MCLIGSANIKSVWGEEQSRYQTDPPCRTWWACWNRSRVAPGSPRCTPGGLTHIHTWHLPSTTNKVLLWFQHYCSLKMILITDAERNVPCIWCAALYLIFVHTTRFWHKFRNTELQPIKGLKHEGVNMKAFKEEAYTKTPTDYVLFNSPEMMTNHLTVIRLSRSTGGFNTII